MEGCRGRDEIVGSFFLMSGLLIADTCGELGLISSGKSLLRQANWVDKGRLRESGSTSSRESSKISSSLL